MAETLQAQNPHRQSSRIANASSNATATFLRKLQDNAPNSTQFLGICTLLISGGVLLLLAGFTLTTAVLGFIFFAPLVIITSPLWFPIGSILFLITTGVLCFAGFGITLIAAASWLYKYYKGHQPPGYDRFDYARNRIADTASHMKDYAREYGGYLQSKVKDAAPGA